MSLGARARAGLEFLVRGFIPPLAFLITFEWKGAKPAIAVAIAATLIQLVVHRLRRHVISPFFITASFFTVLFGGLDLVAHSPRFFKLAPAAENILMGLVFAGSVMVGKPIALWFAQALPESVRPSASDEAGGDLAAYMRKVTIAWSVYFLAKASLLLYFAFRFDLGELIVLRSVIGGPTLALMFGGELYYRKRIRGRRQRRPAPQGI